MNIQKAIQSQEWLGKGYGRKFKQYSRRWTERQLLRAMIEWQDAQGYGELIDKWQKKYYSFCYADILHIAREKLNKKVK